MQISQQESIAVTYLRVTALISIVSCHILQAQDNRWAWVLNIGVQIFFFISGFLYGHKDIEDWTRWYKNRLKKIYVPYIVFCICVFIILATFKNTSISFKNIIIYFSCLQWFGYKVNGLDHLWFVTAILLCYLFTPILQAYKSASQKFAIIFIGYSILEFYIVGYSVPLFMALFVYAMGYLYANSERRFKVIIFCILSIPIAYFCNHASWTAILDYNSLYNRLFHTYGGILLSVLFITFVCNILKSFHGNPTCLKLFSLTYNGGGINQYSYEIYLTHHPLILGSLSLINLTNSIFINIITILLSTAVLSFFLKKGSSLLISTFTKNNITKFFNKINKLQ